MTAPSAATPEEICQAGRAKAAGKYAKCIQNEVAKYYGGGGGGDPARLGKCATKYGAKGRSGEPDS